MTERQHHDVIVIGGGPAGYTAMVYLARDGVDALCVEGFEAGGQLTRTSIVENFPGFPDGVGGAELPERIKAQAGRFGAEFAFDEIVDVDLSQRPFRLGGTLDNYSCDALIVATGSKANRLGLASEAALADRGVAYCAVCDGPMFAGQRVVVVGGGDAAVEHALGLTNHRCEVLLVHRRDELRASVAMARSVRDHPAVELLTPYVVEEILGVEEGRVTGVRLRHVTTGAERVEAVGGVFVSVGHTPSTALLGGQLALTPIGYLKVDPGTSHTSVDGVFAAGDVADARYRQAITAAGSGCAAALDAERWLAARRAGSVGSVGAVGSVAAGGDPVTDSFPDAAPASEPSVPSSAHP